MYIDFYSLLYSVSYSLLYILPLHSLVYSEPHSLPYRLLYRSLYSLLYRLFCFTQISQVCRRTCSRHVWNFSVLASTAKTARFQTCWWNLSDISPVALIRSLRKRALSADAFGLKVRPFPYDLRGRGFEFQRQRFAPRREVVKKHYLTSESLHTFCITSRGHGKHHVTGENICSFITPL